MPPEMLKKAVKSLVIRRLTLVAVILAVMALITAAVIHIPETTPAMPPGKYELVVPERGHLKAKDMRTGKIVPLVLPLNCPIRFDVHWDGKPYNLKLGGGCDPLGVYSGN